MGPLWPPGSAEPPVFSSTPNRHLPYILIACLFLFPLCSACTTFAEAHGPVFGAGIEFDHDLRVSPQIRVGYEYDYYNGHMGYGGGGGAIWSVLYNEVGIYGEFRGFFAMVLGMPISPVAVGSTWTWSPELGWALGVRGGISVNMFWPPEGCYPPFWEYTDDIPPCSGINERQAEDIVYPEWIPRISYRVFHRWGLIPPEGVKGIPTRLSHTFSFDPTISLWYLNDSTPW